MGRRSGGCELNLEDPVGIVVEQSRNEWHTITAQRRRVGLHGADCCRDQRLSAGTSEIQLA
jgi:hypothetical protein